MVGRGLVVLLRRVLAICLRVLRRRRRVGSLRLVGRLGRRVRAGGLRRILILRVLTLRGVLGVGLSRVLRRDEGLLLLLSLILLGLHDEGLLGRGSFGVEQEAAVPAAHEEAMQSPGEAGDEEKPDQGAKACNGSEHVTAGLEEDDVALLEARLAVEQAAIVETRVDGDVVDELGALGGDSGKGREPEDHHDTVEDDDGDDVVDVVQRWDFFAQDGVHGDDPSDDGNGQGETFFVEVRIVHQPSSQSEDDERDENLEDADDKDPSGRDQDVVGLPFRLLHDGRVCCV